MRPAREEDLPSLIEVGRRSWLSVFAQTAPLALIDWWVRMERTKTLYEQHWPEMLVLEEDGRIVGLVHTVEAELNGLWVAPDRHGGGAGTRLLKAGEEAVRCAGHPVAWLTCSALNTSALAFYDRRGYRETARERFVHACGVQVEDVRLERTLGAAAPPPGSAVDASAVTVVVADLSRADHQRDVLFFMKPL